MKTVTLNTLAVDALNTIIQVVDNNGTSHEALIIDHNTNACGYYDGQLIVEITIDGFTDQYTINYVIEPVSTAKKVVLTKKQKQLVSELKAKGFIEASLDFYSEYKPTTINALVAKGIIKCEPVNVKMVDGSYELGGLSGKYCRMELV